MPHLLLTQRFAMLAADLQTHTILNFLSLVVAGASMSKEHLQNADVSPLVHTFGAIYIRGTSGMDIGGP